MLNNSSIFSYHTTNELFESFRAHLVLQEDRVTLDYLVIKVTLVPLVLQVQPDHQVNKDYQALKEALVPGEILGLQVRYWALPHPLVL